MASLLTITPQKINKTKSNQMMRNIKFILGLIIIFSPKITHAQTVYQDSTQILTFEEYIGYVKQHHPLVKQANLVLSTGEANLLKARGSFDPKIEIDYDRKKFKNTEYYDQLNTTFKIPTWYGVEFKGNFEENTGDFLNPNLTVPEGGLYSAGISFSLAQGFLINDRMAMLKKARFFKEQTKADRDILINDLLFEASKSYFKWLEASNEERIYKRFLKNARERFNGIQRSVYEGENAAIDSVEAKIQVSDRSLSYEAALLKKRKAMLQLSNYLWLNDVPIELQDELLPAKPNPMLFNKWLNINNDMTVPDVLMNHPKLKSLDYKIDGLSVDTSLKKNKLLPKIELQYNFLSQDYNQINSFNTSNYKTNLNISLPIFLRKERGDLKLANLKLKDANFERLSTELTIQNKVNSANLEITSLAKQHQLIGSMVKNYTALVRAEERKFYLGESSLFLINSREKNLINTELKENILSIKQLTANASLYHIMGVLIIDAL